MLDWLPPELAKRHPPTVAVQNAVGTSWLIVLGHNQDGVEIVWNGREPCEVYTSCLVWCAPLGEQSTAGAN